MIDFDKFVVMRENFLEELNIAIDKVIREKESMNLDYDLLEKALGVMLRNVKRLEEQPITILIPIKKEKVLKIVLDFFKSIDSEFYNKAINTILQQTENIKMRIYNVHEIEDFSEEDEVGLLKYTQNANVEGIDGYASVHIPTKKELDSEEEKILGKDECGLEDLYAVVHETSHLFDLDLEKGKPDKEELVGGQEKRKLRITRELLGKATAIAFEGLLSEYLLSNTEISKDAIQKMDVLRVNSYLNDARLVYAKLLLAREKSKNGEITLEFVEKLMKDNGFSMQYIRRMANNIIHNPHDMLYQKRYALGGLIAPTIIRKYIEEGPRTLKRYLEEAKNENFEGAINALGIQLTKEGINQLIINIKEQISRIEMKAR